ncbi:hypothetical protein SAMN04487997_2159 [Frateuria terrea]|uniref:Uncharacterized protein n=1 Tax=Frateuria terrea TaxID=529704 RepID=A0A1H6V6Z8_9GAMM|nr:hypothetical protein SAMN04487997_2159 [Frateuria terrea]SFP65700.1 hypothetical protein SAMN02927913_3071 [Frateuria terrea]
MGLTLLAPAAFAQTAGKLDPGSESQVAQQQQMWDRQLQSAAHNTEQAERQAWLRSLANLAKLRIKLAEAWQDMGMTRQGAKLVADAYDPEVAARMHHEPLRGKSDQEVAAMLQAAIREEHFLTADQLLIDYQRNKLNLGANQAPAVNW